VRDIGVRYDEVCRRALQPNLKERFESALEFLSALESLDKVSTGSRKPIASVESKGNAIMKAQKAMQIGKQYAELSAAIRLLEEALQEAPSLTQEYGEVLAKWKSGVVL
jgi:hypothetical protein